MNPYLLTYLIGAAVTCAGLSFACGFCQDEKGEFPLDASDVIKVSIGWPLTLLFFVGVVSKGLRDGYIKARKLKGGDCNGMQRHEEKGR